MAASYAFISTVARKAIFAKIRIFALCAIFAEVDYLGGMIDASNQFCQWRQKFCIIDQSFLHAALIGLEFSVVTSLDLHKDQRYFRIRNELEHTTPAIGQHGAFFAAVDFAMLIAAFNELHQVHFVQALHHLGESPATRPTIVVVSLKDFHDAVTWMSLNGLKQPVERFHLGH